MKSTMIKTTVREIQESLGRYLAILAIVALGVGLYVGLTVTKPDMLAAGENYLEENRLYDLRLVSTIGYDDAAVKAVNEREDVEIAEGEIYTDFLAVDEAGEESVLRAHSMLWKLNQTVVTAGRKPTAGNECMVDAQAYGKDALGATIRVSENNDEDTADMFRYTEYTIVGLCNSSYYINYERGTTALGSGRLKGFVYLPKDGFDTDYYTDIYVFLKDRYGLYSREYDDAVEAAEDWAEPLAEELAQEIRQFLIEKISHTGGHLASNLGVVELTMALHLAFDLPKELIAQHPLERRDQSRLLCLSLLHCGSLLHCREICGGRKGGAYPADIDCP